MDKPRSTYLKLDQKEFEERTERAWELAGECRLCPHLCGVERAGGGLGFCRLSELKVADSGPHFGEELPLVGRRGSGTIFFSGCNLRCIFCQNYDISQKQDGNILTISELVEEMLFLQRKGCHNINFVNPTHVLPWILEGIKLAIPKGLKIPLVYNCGGYESVEALQLLEDIIDIYMPDIKYADDEMGKRYSHVPDYFTVAREAVREMHRQVGDLKTAKGLAIRGLIVRHLVLPGEISGTRQVVRFLAQEISKNTYLNLMPQYYPAYRAKKYPPLNRRIDYGEFQKAVIMARNEGLNRLA